MKIGLQGLNTYTEVCGAGDAPSRLTSSPWLPLAIVTGVVEYLLVAYGPAIRLSDNLVAPVWPAAGAALTSLLFGGYRYAPFLLVGGMVGYIHLFSSALQGFSLYLAAAGFAAAYLLQSMLSVCLIKRFIKIGQVFERASQTIALFAIAIGCCSVGAASSALTVYFIGLQPQTGFGLFIYISIVGCVLSIVHFLPAAILWGRRSRQPSASPRRVEFAALIVTTILVTAGIFTDVLTSTAMATQLYLVFPVVLWAVFRFYPRQMIVVLYIMSAITLYGTLHNTGPFASSDPTESMLNVLTYIGLGVLVALTLSTISAQQKNAERGLRELNSTLEFRVRDRTAELAKAIETLRREIIERHRAERERESMQQQLLEASHRAGMAEIANGVLHNIGNVLNSVNVSTTLIADRIRESRLAGLGRIAARIQEHRESLDEYFSDRNQARKVSDYLTALARQLESERQSVLDEFQTVNKNVRHIKEIICRQQSYASQNSAVERVDLCDLVEHAIRTNLSDQDSIAIRREYAAIPNLTIDRHNTLQIVVNLIQNAKDALEVVAPNERRIVVRLRIADDESIAIEVEDNGSGIEPCDLDKLFHYAFTTKKHGHGFGLHSSAAAAKNIGGNLSATSEGPGRGSCFKLTLPLTLAEDVSA